MGAITISGICVDFPFEAYDSQIVFMEKVIESLNNQQHAILDSPTGTGKTLCLLCATLAWQRHQEKMIKAKKAVDKSCEDKPCRIVYSSRTHSQLKQVVDELKNTNYDVNMVVLASREHYCVHAKIKNYTGMKQNLMCRKAGNSGCAFRTGHKSMVMQKNGSKKKSISSKGEILDIEELVTKMERMTVCPFYYSHDMKANANIVFLPYNYLLDPKYRHSVGIDLNNCIVIFDEGHNVESVAVEASSYSFSSMDLAGCIDEIDKCMQGLMNNTIESINGLSTESLMMLKSLVLEIEKHFDSFTLPSDGSGLSKPGSYVLDFFSKFNINFETSVHVFSIIENAMKGLTGDDTLTNLKLENMLEFLRKIFRSEKNTLKNLDAYRCYIEDVKVKPANRRRKSFSNRPNNHTIRVFNYWCFYPGIAMQELVENQKVYNVILTSGTLSPIHSTVSELGLDFPVRLENKHVVDSSQVWVGVMAKGVTNQRLNSSYRFRSTDEYLLELGNTISSFARTVPNGLLVFFPSYGNMDTAIARWQRPSRGQPEPIWSRISKQKEIYIEPRNTKEFKDVVDDYAIAIKTKAQGAIFFAVCRGKVSEGIDFSNENGRAVVITGLPFPPVNDARIKLKKEYLNRKLSIPGEMKLTGDGWYTQQASRAVNQAIGRVIRHRNDYGAIILCDERFGQQKSALSKWVQPCLTEYPSYGKAHFGINKFYNTNAKRFPSSLKFDTIQDGKMIENVISGEPDIALSMEDSVPDEYSSQFSQQKGFGQTYIQPGSFNKQKVEVLEKKPKTPKISSAVQRTLAERRKKENTKLSLKNVFQSTSNTSSSRIDPGEAAKPPKVRMSLSEKLAMQGEEKERQNHGDGLTTGRESTSRKFGLKGSTTKKGKEDSLKLIATARTLLPPPAVSKFFELVKSIKKNEQVEADLRTVCEMLTDTKFHILLQQVELFLTPSQYTVLQKLKGKMDIAYENSSVTDRMDRLEAYQRAKRHRLNGGDKKKYIATLENPQCNVCLGYPKEPFAANCGHICCAACWKKLANTNRVCPVCKENFHVNKLNAIQVSHRT